MQFKHPEIFWALFLLLIPLIIHFIQLRRFRKTPFTNVRLLQKVTAQSSKTRNLKKWLLLISRLLLLGMLITAFTGPYQSEQRTGQSWETLIYLDNSFSMQARSGDRTLLENTIQELVQGLPENKEFTLFTNDQVFKKTQIKSIQNELLNIVPTYKQLDLQDVLLKSRSLIEHRDQEAELILLTDLQDRFVAGSGPETPAELIARIVALSPEVATNVSVDSVYIANTTVDQIELLVQLQSSAPDSESTPVSLFNGETLIAKSAASFDEGGKSEVAFTLPAGEILDGRIEITDAGLSYDNVLYFSIPARNKTKVMVIGAQPNTYLNRIYVPEEFEFTTSTLAEVNYSAISTQNLIILDELTSLTTALENAISGFVANGGSIVVIPGENTALDSYNNLLGKLELPLLDSLVTGSIRITDINFDHPLFKDVFEKRVSNFNYPVATGYYRTNGNAPKILGYQNNSPFLLGENGKFLFTSPLSRNYSSFINTPLVVPTFYAIAWNSLKTPNLYQYLQDQITMDIPWVAGPDEIIKLRKGTYEFIPLQKRLANKTSLTLTENPDQDGNYEAFDADEFIAPLSFNYPRDESLLTYREPDFLESYEVLDDLPELITTLEKEGKVNELWKWFVILALFFALTEVLIQKLVK